MRAKVVFRSLGCSWRAAPGPASHPCNTSRCHRRRDLSSQGIVSGYQSGRQHGNGKSHRHPIHQHDPHPLSHQYLLEKTVFLFNAQDPGPFTGPARVSGIMERVAFLTIYDMVSLAYTRRYTLCPTSDSRTAHHRRHRAGLLRSRQAPRAGKRHGKGHPRLQEIHVRPRQQGRKGTGEDGKAMTISRLTRSFFSRILHLVNHEPAAGHEPAFGLRALEAHRPRRHRRRSGRHRRGHDAPRQPDRRGCAHTRQGHRHQGAGLHPLHEALPRAGTSRHPRFRDARGDDDPRHQDAPVLRRDRHAGGREETAGLGDRPVALPELRHGADPLRPDPGLLLCFAAGRSSRTRSFSTSSKGIIRLGIFLTFLATTLFMEDMRRVFMYHGAEHKTVFAWEHGQELTIENIRQFSTRHPRCGTSFILVVIVTRSSYSRCSGDRIS